jgi:hypothetical protein
MSDENVSKFLQPNSARYQFIRLVLSISAGFAATKLTERGFDCAILKYRNRNASPTVEA